MVGVDDGKDASNGLAEVVAVKGLGQYVVLPCLDLRGCRHVIFDTRRSAGQSECSHLVQLGAGRSDLLDAELTELSLELTELLGEVLLVLSPKGTSLDLA